MTTEETVSKTISFLRFPLIVAVIFIHDQYTDMEMYPLYENVSFLVSQLLTKPAVPLFFLISGLLFFRDTEDFPVSVYRRKLGKRVHSLLIPYLLWNAAVLILSYVRQRFFAEMGASNIGLTDYGFLDYLKAFWGTGSGASSRPIAFQFWFIRDLMVVMLLTPPVHFLIEKAGTPYLAVTGLLWFFHCWFDLTGLSIMALFFFSLGAAVSLKKIDLIRLLSKGRPYFLTLYPLLIAACFLARKTAVFPYLDNLSLLTGMAAILSLTSLMVGKGTWKVSPFLSRSSFFLFAYHGLAISWLLKLSRRLLQPDTDLQFLTIYLVAPLIVITVGLACYFLMEKTCPGLTALLTGNRNKR